MSDHVPDDWRLVSGAIICQMRDGDPRNSDLIAAAPELLEALKWALDYVPDDLDPDHHEALENAHAVVQRAGGYL